MELLVIAGCGAWLWYSIRKTVRKAEPNKSDQAPARRAIPSILRNLLSAHGINLAFVDDIYIINDLTEEMMRHLKSAHKAGHTRGLEIAEFLVNAKIGTNRDVVVILTLLRDGEEISFATRQSTPPV